MKIKIQNGMIIDGTGRSPEEGEIGVVGRKIIEMGSKGW